MSTLSKEEISRRRQEWFNTCDKRKSLIERICAAYNSGEKELARQLSSEMRALDPRMCEHERSWSSTCMACDEIHKECFPENYVCCAACQKLFDSD
jgi:hypothetical protein